MISPEKIAAIRRRLKECLTPVDVAMSSCCGEYQCDCHRDMPSLLDELERLRAENERLLAVFGDLREDSPAARAIYQEGEEAARSRMIDGVAIIRYPGDRMIPGGKTAREVAVQMSESLRPGSVVGLPSTRDADGYYLWDIEIRGGKFDQIRIERQGEEVQ